VKRSLSAGRSRSDGLKLDVFTEDEIQYIHFATLEVRERTGVWVELDEALDICADGGCVVDR
jgi:trimethylamine--corrinoid protein Co-methyltransferase